MSSLLKETFSMGVEYAFTGEMGTNEHTTLIILL